LSGAALDPDIATELPLDGGSKLGESVGLADDRKLFDGEVAGLGIAGREDDRQSRALPGDRARARAPCTCGAGERFASGTVAWGDVVAVFPNRFLLLRTVARKWVLLPPNMRSFDRDPT
jgi:hypothetical protein